MHPIIDYWITCQEITMPFSYDTPIKTDANNLERVLQTGAPALIVFEAPNCEPCTSLDSVLKDFARTYAGKLLIVRVEDARQGDLQTRYQLTRLPTLLVWKNGTPANRIEGAAAKDAIRANLEYLAGERPQPTPASGPSFPLPGHNQADIRPPASANSPAQTNQPPSDGRPIAVTDASFETDVIRSGLPVLVDFWAPWCGPCRMVSPIVEELGREYRTRIRIAKVNTDDNPRWASRLGVQGIPTLILFKDGKEVDRIVGAAPKPSYKQFIERSL
jgi:thioredoxin